MQPLERFHSGEVEQFVRPGFHPSARGGRRLRPAGPPLGVRLPRLACAAHARRRAHTRGQPAGHSRSAAAAADPDPGARTASQARASRARPGAGAPRRLPRGRRGAHTPAARSVRPARIRHASAQRASMRATAASSRQSSGCGRGPPSVGGRCRAPGGLTRCSPRHSSVWATADSRPGRRAARTAPGPPSRGPAPLRLAQERKRAGRIAGPFPYSAMTTALVADPALRPDRVTAALSAVSPAAFCAAAQPGCRPSALLPVGAFSPASVRSISICSVLPAFTANTALRDCPALVDLEPVPVQMPAPSGSNSLTRNSPSCRPRPCRS